MWKKLLWCAVVCVVGCGLWGANLQSNNDKKDDPKTEDPDCCDDSCNECVDYKFSFGQAANDPDVPSGYFSIYTLRPNLNLYSPINLYYYHPLFTRITKDEISDGKRTVMIQGSRREPEEYVFTSGEKVGYPGDNYRNRLDKKLVMLNAEQEPVTESPVYYRMINTDGSFVTYSVAEKKAVSYTTRTGRILTISSPDLRLDVVYSNEGAPQQVFSGTDGLADIQVVDVEHGYILGYEIRLYAPNQIGAKNTNGLYAFTGSPHTTYRVQNPDHPIPYSCPYWDDAQQKWVDSICYNPPPIRKAIFTKTANSLARTTSYTYSDVLDDWVMDVDDMKIVSRERIWNANKDAYTETMTVKDAQGTISYQETMQKYSFPFGELTTEKTIGAGDNAPKTWYTYYSDDSNSANYGKLATERHSNGFWKKYSYDSQERITMIVSPFKNQTIDVAQKQAKVEYRIYSPVDPRDQPYLGDPRPRVREVRINDIPVSKEYWAYFHDGNGEYVEVYEQCRLTTAEYGNASNARTEKRYYASNADVASAGRLKSVRYPDGKLDTYTYAYGNYAPNANPGSSAFTVAEGGFALKTTVMHGIWDSPNGVALKSTREEFISDAYGNPVMRKEFICTDAAAPSHEEIFWSVATFDNEHRELRTINSQNEETNTTWNCCKMESFTDTTGTQYTYIYDGLLRLVTETKTGIGDQPDLVTSYTYDANGQILTKTIQGGNLTLTESYEYDLAQRPTKIINPTGLVILYAYGDKTITETYGDGSNIVMTRYNDQSFASITGNSTVNTFFDSGLIPEGGMWTKKTFAVADSPRFETTYQDLSGRTIKVERSGFGGTVTEQSFYNTKGELTKVLKTGMAPILLAYDEWGNQSEVGLDVDNDGQLRPASLDRIIKIGQYGEKINGNWFLTAVRQTYAADNQAALTTLGKSSSRLNGFSSGMVQERRDIDIWGNQTTETVTIDRGARQQIVLTNTPESSVDSQQIITNGLLTSVRTAGDLTTAYSYDGLARQISVTRPRTGATQYTYYTDGAGRMGQLFTQTDPAGNVTTYDYESATGRLSSVKNALNQYTRYAYDTYGNVTSIWGDSPYPVTYTYDNYGQQTSMKTFRTGTQWNAASWPTGVTGDQTTWTYDTASGLVTAKTDAAGKSTAYSYSVDGKLTLRTWARTVDGQPLTTAYSYYPATGQLQKIDYSDSTPDITYTYNRLGMAAAIQDAAGTRNFNYDEHLALISETIHGIYNKVIARSYTDTGMKGKVFGMSVDGTPNYSCGYDQYGRLNRITTPAGNFDYTRLPNSDLVSQLARPNGVTTTWSYEPHRDLVTQLANGTISTFDYVNNAIGNRTSMARGGSAFTAPDIISYGYDSRAEVTSAQSNQNSNYNYAYNFDPIGNRITSNLAGTAYNYTSNFLNQYTAINAETPTYDADGNMLTRDGWTQVWNGENRLIETSKDNIRLTFNYDYMGRRIEKKVYDGENLTRHLKFVYDEYKLIEELNGSDSTTAHRYVWQPENVGLDVPLSIQDVSANASYFYTTDANKNITGLLDNNGVSVAHYEYSPFGMQTSATGSYATENPFRFSSEYFDSETSLVYYNYRYYDSKLGRWISQDPLEESGGINLFSFCENNGVLRYDILGNSIFDWLPITSTIRHALSDPRGRSVSDYTGISPSKEECCDDNSRSAAIKKCNDNIAIQMAKFLILWFGDNVGPGAEKAVVAYTADKIIGKLVAKKAIRAGVGAAVNILLGVDGVVDFAIQTYKAMQITMAANAAKARYCVCP